MAKSVTVYPNGFAILQHRGKLGLSRDEVYSRTGIRAKTLAEIEDDQPTNYNNLKKLAHLFSVEPETLLAAERPSKNAMPIVLIVVNGEQDGPIIDQAIEVAKRLQERHQVPYQVLDARRGSLRVLVVTTEDGYHRAASRFESREYGHYMISMVARIGWAEPGSPLRIWLRNILRRGRPWEVYLVDINGQVNWDHLYDLVRQVTINALGRMGMISAVARETILGAIIIRAIDELDRSRTMLADLMVTKRGAYIYIMLVNLVNYSVLSLQFDHERWSHLPTSWVTPNLWAMATGEEIPSGSVSRVRAAGIATSLMSESTGGEERELLNHYFAGDIDMQRMVMRFGYPSDVSESILALVLKRFFRYLMETYTARRRVR